MILLEIHFMVIFAISTCIQKTKSNAGEKQAK